MNASAYALLAVVATAVASIPGRVEAQTTRQAVVLDFDGPGGAAARQVVVRAIADRVTLVESDRVEDAARRQRADLTTAAGLAAVARRLSLSLFVLGEVSGRGRRARVSIRVLDADGNEVAQRETGAPVGRAGQRRVAAAAVEAIDQALGVLDERARAEREREEQEEQARIRHQPEGERDVAFEVDDEEFDEDEPDAEVTPLLLGMVGVGGRTRSAVVRARDDAMSGREYQPVTFPELALQVELRPAARSDGVLAGLLVRGGVGFGLGLSTVDDDGDRYDTGWLRASGGLGYLHRLSTVEVGAVVDAGIERFSISPNAVFPTASYTYVRPALAGALRLLENRLTLTAEIGYRIGMGVGGLVPFFGAAGSAGGFDVGIDGRYRLGQGPTLGAMLGWRTWSLSFEGDPDAMMEGALAGGDGSDGGFVFMALGGWAL
ncbi:MAG: hypothetical protein NZ898_07175 [Myxococcota bacterium]|nr:hypothetical protein [Myxococcota bacterium]MDW8362591.1 hypothetical protein [Myxococcales bacterium]